MYQITPYRIESYRIQSNRIKFHKIEIVSKLHRIESYRIVLYVRYIDSESHRSPCIGYVSNRHVRDGYTPLLQTSLPKIADLQAHNASQREAL